MRARVAAMKADRLSNRLVETGALFARDRTWHPPALTPFYKTTVARSPQRAPIAFDNTLSELTGPVFGHHVLGELDNDLTLNFAQPGESAIGERIIVYGRVLDERGKGLAGLLMEFWQANAGGRYRHKNDRYVAPLDPNFGGCGRTITGEDGSYALRTVKPGPYPWPNGPNDWRPSHIHFSIFGHSFGQRLITQMYFEGDPLIWSCPIVRTVPDRAAIERLIAAYDAQATVPMDARAYKFDIVLRGRRSSLFENRREGN
jgi:protocatechuate 3,4-dioxygenase beta subunit